MDTVNIVIEMLKTKKYITQLEKDILDTWHELQKQPFDMVSARLQSFYNERKYPQIAAVVAALPCTVQKPSAELTATDLRYVLTMQLSGLIAKEQAQNG